MLCDTLRGDGLGVNRFAVVLQLPAPGGNFSTFPIKWF